MMVRSGDKGKTWSSPELVYDDPYMDDRNPAVSCMKDGTICLVWDKYLDNEHHWAWMIQSSDGGYAWSEPVKISDDKNVHTRGRPVDIGDGKWLIPFARTYCETRCTTYFSIYDREYETFQEIAVTPVGLYRVADEASVVKTDEGELIALIRSNVDPELWQISSVDGGYTWSKPEPSGIPSQFTPADLIKLKNGWLLCSFSFRERRNERLLISRDNGRTWDIENSLDVYTSSDDYKLADRSYPSSVQIDDRQIGTVLYETTNWQTGGYIWFVVSRIADFRTTTENVLYQSDIHADAAFAVFKENVNVDDFYFSYRFTGLFGPPPNAVGILMDFRDSENYTAFEFQMGAAPDKKSIPYNYIRFVECEEGEIKEIYGSRARGGWFDNGNIHSIKVTGRENRWVFTIDGIEQYQDSTSVGGPRGMIIRRAAVAIYDMDF